MEEADGIRFLTMGLVEGQTLDRLIPENGLSLDQLLGAARADALAAAHVDVPPQVGEAILRCLAEDLRDRFPAARDVFIQLDELRSSAPRAPTARGARAESSIAVLPFVGRSDDSGDDYFSDGVSEELIDAQSELQGPQVTARTSTFQFRVQEIDAWEVGRKLGVSTLLEGSVRVAGNRLRIANLRPSMPGWGGSWRRAARRSGFWSWYPA